MLQVPAAVRFVSCEPLLGPVRLDDNYNSWLTCTGTHYHGIDWVIVGGESGSKRRTLNLAWARDLRDQCRDAEVAFFMKQIDKRAPIPDDLMIREFPETQQTMLAGGER